MTGSFKVLFWLATTFISRSQEEDKIRPYVSKHYRA